MASVGRNSPSLHESPDEVRKRKEAAERRVRERHRLLITQTKEKHKSIVEERARLTAEMKEKEARRLKKEHEEMTKQMAALERDKARKAEVLARNNANASRLSANSKVAFGSASPRELSYLDHLPKSQKVYDLKLKPPKTSAVPTTPTRAATAMTTSLYVPTSSSRRPATSRPMATPTRTPATPKSNLMTQSFYTPSARPATTANIRTTPRRTIVGTTNTTTSARSVTSSAPRPSTGAQKPQQAPKPRPPAPARRSLQMSTVPQRKSPTPEAPAAPVAKVVAKPVVPEVQTAATVEAENTMHEEVHVDMGSTDGERNDSPKPMGDLVPQVVEEERAPVPEVVEEERAPVPVGAEHESAPVPVVEQESAPVPQVMEEESAPVPDVQEASEEKQTAPLVVPGIPAIQQSEEAVPEEHSKMNSVSLNGPSSPLEEPLVVAETQESPLIEFATEEPAAAPTATVLPDETLVVNSAPAVEQGGMDLATELQMAFGAAKENDAPVMTEMNGVDLATELGLITLEHTASEAEQPAVALNVTNQVFNLDPVANPVEEKTNLDDIELKYDEQPKQENGAVNGTAKEQPEAIPEPAAMSSRPPTPPVPKVDEEAMARRREKDRQHNEDIKARLAAVKAKIGRVSPPNGGSSTDEERSSSPPTPASSATPAHPPPATTISAGTAALLQRLKNAGKVKTSGVENILRRHASDPKLDAPEDPSSAQ